MAHGAGVMDLRIIGIYGVAGGRMATRAVSGHGNPAGVIDTGMIILKGAMTG